MKTFAEKKTNPKAECRKDKTYFFRMLPKIMQRIYGQNLFGSEGVFFTDSYEFRKRFSRAHGTHTRVHM